MKTRLATSIAALAIATVAYAQQAASPFELPGERAYLIDKIKTLSSDEFAGRKPASAQEPMIIDYIAKSFEEAGLQPGGVDGTWFQPVKLVSTMSSSRGGVLNIKAAKSKITLNEMNDYVMWSNRAVSEIKLKNREYVFCGFGIDAPEFGWNDFEGVDVKDKIIVCMVGDPGFYNDDLFHGKNITYYARYTYKYEEGRRRGAAGVMVVHNTKAASYGWNVVRNGASTAKQELCNENLNMDDIAFKGWFTEESAGKLLSACGYDPERVYEDAKKPGFKSFPLKARSDIALDVKTEVSESHNVLGILPGTDLKDEYVLYAGHWDHLGVGLAVDGDSIYNGAADNAAGVSVIMTIAKRFTASKAEHRRSLVFMAVTAEETGLLGGQYYCENPVYPIEKTAVAINIDGGAPESATHDISLRGAGNCEVDQYLEAAATAQGRYIRKTYTDPAGISYRTDLFNFLKVGIPGLLVGGGSDYVDKAAHDALPKVNTYHSPNDEYHDWWPLDGTFQTISLYHAMGLMISNADKMPQWLPGSNFHR